MKITIDLHPDGARGTVATVERRRFFSTVTEKYICTGASVITGGRWVNKDPRGKNPSDELSHKLNLAADAEAWRKHFGKPTNG